MSLDMDEFTQAGCRIASLFVLNVKQIGHLIELSGIIIDKLEKGEIKHTMNKEQLLRMKHLILLDALARTIVIVEGTIALCSVLSQQSASMRDVAHCMTSYSQDKIDSFMKGLDRGKISIWRLAGFPELGELQKRCGLGSDERMLMHKLLENSCKAVQKALGDIVRFYQVNRVFHGKFKHGLTFLLGLTGGLPQDESLSSVSVAFDRRNKAPPVYIPATSKPPVGYEWFNTMSILPYRQETFERINQTLSDTTKLVSYMVNNHLMRVVNQGECYLPYQKQPDGTWKLEIYVDKQLTQREQEEFDSIIKKIEPHVRCVDMSFAIEFNFQGNALKKIIRDLKRDQIATLFYDQAFDR